MSDDQDRFADDAKDVPANLGPKAFPPELWARIPVDLQPEAAERAAWLVFRGETVKEALIVALEGMRDDMDDLEVQPSWSTVRALAAIWPRLPRSIDGRYRREILNLAAAVESCALDSVQVGAGHGDLDDRVDRFPTEEIRSIALGEVQERERAIRAALEAPDMDAIAIQQG